MKPRRKNQPNGCISELVHKYTFVPAVVIGGAPCREKDAKLLPKSFQANAIWISANDHGCLQQRCDYIVACEDLGERLTKWHIPLISQHPWADYRVFDVPLPNSAALGGFAAWAMGCAPIVFIGVECFQGKTYLHEPNAESSGKSLSVAEHLKRWSKLPVLAPNGQFRAVSGPLLSIFQCFDPLEAITSDFVAPTETVRKICTGIPMSFLEGTQIHERTYQRGEICEVSALEERKLARENRAKLVSYDEYCLLKTSQRPCLQV